MIEVDGLWKVYDVKKQRAGFGGGLKDLLAPIHIRKEAVKGISFQVGAGESVGYIGSNGSGKSTTIKMLTGVLRPTEGKVMVGGIDPFRERKRNAAQIGVVFGQRSQLWWDLPIAESLDVFRHIYRVPERRFKQNLAAMMDMLALHEFVSTPVRQLSLGQRMRAELACAFLHNPLVVYLDEPTIGLDVWAKERIRGFLREVKRERKTTIILTTHDMNDIEEVCERIILIESGSLLFDGATAAFIAANGSERHLTIELAQQPLAIHSGMARLVGQDGREATFAFDPAKVAATDLLAELAASYSIVDFKLKEPNVEQMVNRFYRSGKERHA
jgi:ABC-2 type transport system ATP-binding protein